MHVQNPSAVYHKTFTTTHTPTMALLKISVLVGALVVNPIFVRIQEMNAANHDTQLVLGNHSFIHQRDTARSLHNAAQVLGHVSRFKQNNYMVLGNCGGDMKLLEELKVLLREVDAILPSVPSVDFVNELMCSDGFKNDLFNNTSDHAPVRVNHQNWGGLGSVPIEENCEPARQTAIVAYFKTFLGPLYEKGVLRKCPNDDNVCANTHRADELTQLLRKCNPNVSEEIANLFGIAMQILTNVRSTTEAKNTGSHVVCGIFAICTFLALMYIVGRHINWTRSLTVIFIAFLLKFPYEIFSVVRDCTYYFPWRLHAIVSVCLLLVFWFREDVRKWEDDAVDQKKTDDELRVKVNKILDERSTKKGI